MWRSSLFLCVLGGWACVYVRRLRDEPVILAYLRSRGLSQGMVDYLMSWMGVSLLLAGCLLSVLLYNSLASGKEGRGFHVLTTGFIGFWGLAAWADYQGVFPEWLGSAAFWAGWPERWIAALVVALFFAGNVSLLLPHRLAVGVVAVSLSGLYAIGWEIYKPNDCIWWSLTQVATGLVGAGHYWLYHQRCVPHLRFYSDR